MEIEIEMETKGEAYLQCGGVLCLLPGRCLLLSLYNRLYDVHRVHHETSNKTGRAPPGKPMPALNLASRKTSVRRLQQGEKGKTGQNRAKTGRKQGERGEQTWFIV